MPENKDSTHSDKSLSEQQLDDLDVNRQRERLERSRPGNLQSGDPQNAQGDQSDQQPGAGSARKDRH